MNLSPGRARIRPLQCLLSGKESGVALITVILVISLLAIFMVEFAYNTRIKLRMSSNFARQLKALTIARGGVDAAADLLLYDSKQGDFDFYTTAPGITEMTDPSQVGALEEIWSWAAQGIPLTYPVGDGTLVLQISDESAKVNLNLVEDAKMRGVAYRLFDSLIAIAPEIENPVDYKVIVDSIWEWIDGNQEPETESLGVEGNYYEGLEPAYSAKDGRMDSVSELRLVYGIPAGLFRHLMEAAGIEAKNSDALGSPLITVFPQHGSPDKINVNTAPPPVFEALHSTFTPGLVEEITEYRRETPFKKIADFLQQFVPDQKARIDLQGLIDVKSDTFSIASTGVIGTIAVTVRAVLKRDRKKNRVAILYWRVEG